MNTLLPDNLGDAAPSLSFQDFLEFSVVGFVLPPTYAADDWLAQLKKATCLPFGDDGDLCATLGGFERISELR